MAPPDAQGPTDPNDVVVDFDAPDSDGDGIEDEVIDADADADATEPTSYEAGTPAHAEPISEPEAPARHPDAKVRVSEHEEQYGPTDEGEAIE